MLGRAEVTVRRTETPSGWDIGVILPCRVGGAGKPDTGQQTSNLEGSHEVREPEVMTVALAELNKRVSLKSSFTEVAIIRASAGPWRSGSATDS